MAEISTLARPYAEAVFKLALEENDTAGWSDQLQGLAAVAQDPAVAQLVGNPKLDKTQLVTLFTDVLQGYLSPEGQQLLQLLVHNHRVEVLPAIRDQYAQLLHDHVGQLDAHIESAFQMTSQEVQALVHQMESRFGKKVNPEVTVNDTLIGGVRITVGDVVIDSSVRARLAQMAVALKR